MRMTLLLLAAGCNVIDPNTDLQARVTDLEAAQADLQTQLSACDSRLALIEMRVEPSPPIAKILSRTRKVMSVSQVSRSSASGSERAILRTSSRVVTNGSRRRYWLSIWARCRRPLKST